MDKKTIHDCKEVVSQTNIVLKEKKSIYKAINRNNEDILKYKVDGCLYRPGSKAIRCDYLLDANRELYFIELKGSDIKKGLKQVLSSIKNLEQYFTFNSTKARIITTRGTKPKRLNTYKEYRDLLRLIGKDGIVLSNSPYEENIN